MKDHEYILTEINREIKESLETIENRMVSGDVASMEDYKYNLGFRNSLKKLKEYITLLNREDV